MNESQLHKFYKCSLYPRDSEIYSDKEYVNIDNGSMGGSHWTCSKLKDNISYYFDSFGGQPDKFLFKHLSKPVIFHIYKKKIKFLDCVAHIVCIFSI